MYEIRCCPSVVRIRALLRNFLNLGSLLVLLLSSLLVPVFSVAHADTWVQQNGPYCGYVPCLMVDPQGSLYAGTQNGGVFRSRDAAASWVGVSVGLVHKPVYVWCLETTLQGKIFAGTEFGLYKSTDEGNSWASQGLAGWDYHIRSLLSVSEDTIFVGTYYQGIYRSVDSGLTWTSVNNGIDQGTRAMALAITPGDAYLRPCKCLECTIRTTVVIRGNSTTTEFLGPSGFIVSEFVQMEIFIFVRVNMRMGSGGLRTTE